MSSDLSKTQRERLVALLAEFGIQPMDETCRYPAPDYDPQAVTLLAHHGGVDGYSSFYAVFEFDDAGQFKTVGVWE